MAAAAVSSSQLFAEWGDAKLAAEQADAGVEVAIAAAREAAVTTAAASKGRVIVFSRSPPTTPAIVALQQQAISARTAVDVAYDAYVAGTDVDCVGCKHKLKGNAFDVKVFENSQKVRSHSVKKRFGAVYQARCLSCQTAQRREKTYNCDPNTQAELRDNQNNQCGVCHATLISSGEGANHLDHNHQTGAVRGWLCPACNLCIRSQDDKEMGMLKALQIAKYLAETDPASFSGNKQKIRDMLKTISDLEI